MELVLGTAQWGVPYGITNQVGRLTNDEVARVVSVAVESGIRNVDTACGYGDAQMRLRPWARDLRITTKVKGDEAGSIPDSIYQASRELGVETIDSCLLHDWDALSPDQASKAAASIEEARDSGLIQSVGVSVYGVQGLESALMMFDHLDQVQVPANAIDRRLESEEIMTVLMGLGTRVQVRSVLLQGLLSGPSSNPLGSHIAIRRYLDHCQGLQVDPVGYALAHVRALPWASEVVIGVTSSEELEHVVAAWKAMPPTFADPELACGDLSLIDPRNWPTLPSL